MRISLPKSNDGIALIIVMLVILTLTTLAAGFALTMKVEMKLAAQANYDQQMEWAGRSGVELARFYLTEQDKLPGPKIHSLSQAWAGGPGLDASNSPIATIPLKDNLLGAATFSVTITDLERKFNINTVLQNPGLLQQCLLVMGVDATASSTVSDSVLDWIDLDSDTHQSGAENEFYLSQDPPYYCKNGLVDDISELLLVKGVTPDIFWGSNSTNRPATSIYQAQDNSPFPDKPPNYPFGLFDLFTPLSGGKLNINTAPASTMKIIFGGDENIATAVVQQRAGPDGQDGTADDTPFLRPDDFVRNTPGINPGAFDSQRITALCDVRSYTFEVTVDVKMGEYSRQYIAIVRRLGNNAYGVLSFHGK